MERKRQLELAKFSEKEPSLLTWEEWEKRLWPEFEHLDVAMFEVQESQTMQE